MQEVAQQGFRIRRGQVDHGRVDRVVAQHLPGLVRITVAQHAPLQPAGEQGIGQRTGTVGIGSGEEDAHPGGGVTDV